MAFVSVLAALAVIAVIATVIEVRRDGYGRRPASFDSRTAPAAPAPVVEEATTAREATAPARVAAATVIPDPVPTVVAVARPPGRPRLGREVGEVRTVRLDPELEAAVLARAARDGSSRSAVIREALRAWLDAA